MQLLRGLWADSTRGIATSWAQFRGIFVSDICAAASLVSPVLRVPLLEVKVYFGLNSGINTGNNSAFRG